MSKFAEFNKAINTEQVKKNMAQAKENEYKEVPKGRYAVKFEKMEIGVTGANAKTPNAPMFKLQARITGGVDKDGDVVKCGSLTSFPYSSSSRPPASRSSTAC